MKAFSKIKKAITQIYIQKTDNHVDFIYHLSDYFLVKVRNENNWMLKKT